MSAHILLVEPDRKLAMIYARALECQGYTVTSSMHAQDAIFAADAHKPDLVLLELQLSGHGGVEFLHEFRSYTEWQSVPVMLVTLVPPQSLALTAQTMEMFGIARYVYKPAVTLRQLCSLVDDVVSVAV